MNTSKKRIVIILSMALVVTTMIACSPKTGTESEEGEGPEPNDMAAVLIQGTLGHDQMIQVS